MVNNLIPFNDEYLSRVVGSDGHQENSVLSRTKEGFPKLELQIVYPDGRRKYFMIVKTIHTDYTKEITIHPFNSLEERNFEIARLYIEEGMSQAFIAKIFGLSQPSISNIIRKQI